jgi:anti-anti-sigma factor
MGFEISIRNVTPDTAVVTMNGPLTLGTSLKIADTQIQEAIRGGAKRLVLDMTGVPYMDSAGLGALVMTHGLTKAQGGVVRLAAASERVAGLLTMTGMDTLMAIDANVDASLAALG